MKKADREARFVQELLDDGGKVKSYGATYHRGNYYWCFMTGNHTMRYWTNMSRENLRKLGVADDYCKEVV